MNKYFNTQHLPLKLKDSADYEYFINTISMYSEILKIKKLDANKAKKYKVDQLIEKNKTYFDELFMLYVTALEEIVKEEQKVLKEISEISAKEQITVDIEKLQRKQRILISNLERKKGIQSEMMMIPR